MEITVCCGTVSATRDKFTFDIDSYSQKNNGTGVRKGAEDMAITLLKRTMDDVSFMDDGYRNDDAVNLCIALYVLGYDPWKWFEDWIEDDKHNPRFWDCDIQKFEEHITRIIPYLEKWGPANDRAKALAYAI